MNASKKSVIFNADDTLPADSDIRRSVGGYSETDIHKIWGENLLRVWEAVEQHVHGS